MLIAIDARVINSTTGRYVQRLIHYLEELDTQNDYIVLVPKKDLDFYKPSSPRFRVIEADFDNYSFGEQWGLLKLLNRLKPDLVHFCMPQQPILYRGKHVTTIHDLILLNTYNSDKNFIVFKLKQLVGRFVFYRIGRTSARIITPTHYVKDAYQAFARIPAEKIAVTYNGGDVPRVTPKPYQALEAKRFLLYVGQQSDYKNIRRLMQAHQILRRTHPDLQLVLTGPLTGRNGPPLIANKTWAEQQGFEGILFTGFVPDEQLVWLYRHCASYTFPSLMEGFGLPALEAMMAGAIVTSSNASCLPEVYQDAVHYFDPLDVNDMAVKINDVLTDETLRADLRKKGKELVKRYSWKKTAEETLVVYKQVLSNSAKPEIGIRSSNPS